jgi:molybdopterin molybdotransferase
VDNLNCSLQSGEKTLARLKGFEKLTNVDEALTLFLKALQPKRLDSTTIPLDKALGRVTAKIIKSPHDLPAFDRSAVDGYAVRAKDTFGASQFRTKTIHLTNKKAVNENQARQIWTGNPMPQGADAVIMLEHTKAVKQKVEILSALTPGENVSKRGEDIRKDETVVETGVRLQPHHVGLLAALGISHVDVVEKPKVATLSTGNELVELDKKAQTYQIMDSNRYMLAGLIKELGAEPESLGIAQDNEEELTAKIAKGLTRADVVITTGGTSVGAMDLVPTVINKMGKPGVIVHGVALRPGMPTALAILRNKPVFVLSGYPVAATVGFEVFVRPVILKLLGVPHELRPMLKAKMTKRISGALGRRVYLRVSVYQRGDDFFVDPLRTKGSGLLTSMTRANGYVIIPEDRDGLDQDETVLVHLFAPVRSDKHV